jgi:DHA1 family multidrug resistance protein-like MFS transporter
MNKLSNWLAPTIILLFAETLAIVGFSITMPIIPLYIQDSFNIHDPDQIKFWNGMLNGLPSLMLAIFAPIWGTIADRTGRKLMLLRAMLGGALAIGLMVFAQNVYQLFILRLLQGIMTGSIASANVLLLSIIPSHHAALGLGLMATGVYVGSALGPMLGGIVYDMYGGHINFLFSASLLVASGFLVFGFVKEHFTRPQNLKPFSLLPDFSLLLHNPFLRFLLLSVFASQIAFSLVSANISLFVQEIVQNSQEAIGALLSHENTSIGGKAGLVVGSAAIAASLGALFFAALSKRISLKMSIMLSMSGAALCYLPQAFSHTWQFLLIFRMIDAFFVGGISPVINATISSITAKDQQGAVFGLSSSLSFMGSAVGPLLGSGIAVLLGSLGNRAIFIVGTLILVVLIWVLTVHKEYWERNNQKN